MKNTKKIIPALAMLLVSALMLTTASFAWFAMNSTTTASGMDVTLKSNNPYLLISANETLATMQATPSSYTSATANNTNTTGSEILAPVAHVETLDVNGVETATNWYTMKGTDVNNGAGITTGGDNSDGKYPITALDGYVVEYTYTVCMDANSPVGGNLKLASAVSVKDDGANTSDKIKPICVIITCGNVFVELNENNSWTSETILSATVPNTGTALTLNVYVYYNGNHSDVTSAKQLSGDIAGANISFTLQIDE